MKVTAAEKRWSFIRRYLWRVGLFALAALVFSWIVTHATTTTYKAETVIAFKSTELPLRFEFLKLFNNPLPIFLEDDIYSVTYDIPSILASDKITGLVIERGNFKERLYDPEEYPIYQEWFDDFHSHLMFELHPQVQTMTIAYDAETPELAVEITQLYTEEFENYFASQYWRYSVADAIEEVFNRRQEELLEIERTIDEYLLDTGKVAVRREAAQDVMDYLLAERSRIRAWAEARSYEVAVERVRAEMDTAARGEKFSLVTEALFDPVLIFLKAMYFQGNKRLVELEGNFTTEYPEVAFWHKALPKIEELTREYSVGAVQTSINTLIMRGLESKARTEYWTKKAAELRLNVEGLPGFEKDLYWLLRKQVFLDVTLWFWGRRLEFHRLGEEFMDNPFVTLDEPIVPERAYYPIFDYWIYAFPVLLMVGTLWFLLRYKLEEECIEDIESGRL